jgi:hypothetical protein
MRASIFFALFGAGLVSLGGLGVYLTHRDKVARVDAIQKRAAEARRREAEAHGPLTDEEAYQKRHAEQLAALDAAQAAEDARIAKQKADAACRQDVACWSKPFLIDAEVKCARKVENLAQYQYEWTNSIFGESKFLDPVWTDANHKTFVLAGHAIKMQNGFGAWKKVAYLCVFDPATGIADATALK